MVIILIGKTGSGKSTIIKELEKDGFQTVVEYTTRPKREGETNGVDYYYINDHEFDQMDNKNLFVEKDIFHTVYGIWKYGALKKDFENGNKVCAMGPAQYMQFVKSGIPAFSVLVDIPDELVFERCMKRGDSENEVKRRLEADAPKYAEAEHYVSLKVNGNNTVECIMDSIRKGAGYENMG